MPDELSLEDAAALVRPDRLAGGPARSGSARRVPHALGGRDDWEDLQVFGACSSTSTRCSSSPACTTSAASSGRPSGSCRDAGADIQFVPADFRRFAADRSSASRPGSWPRWRRRPTPTGWMQPLAPRRRHRRRAAPGRRRPRPRPGRRGQRQLPPDLRPRPDHRHRLHVDEIDVLVDERPRPRSSSPTPSPADVERAIAAARRRSSRRRHPPDRHRRHPLDRRRAPRRGRRRRLRHPLRDVHHRADAAAPGRQGHQRPQGHLRRLLGHHVRRRHRPSSTSGSTATTTCASCRSTSSTRPRSSPATASMVTINGAIAVDLSGQVVADTIDGAPVLRHRRPRGLRRRRRASSSRTGR